jgi:hypothetical protein
MPPTITRVPPDADRGAVTYRVCVGFTADHFWAWVPKRQAGVHDETKQVNQIKQWN